MFSTKDAQRFENRAKSIDKIMNLFPTLSPFAPFALFSSLLLFCSVSVF